MKWVGYSSKCNNLFIYATSSSLHHGQKANSTCDWTVGGTPFGAAPRLSARRCAFHHPDLLGSTGAIRRDRDQTPDPSRRIRNSSAPAGARSRRHPGQTPIPICETTQTARTTAPKRPSLLASRGVGLMRCRRTLQFTAASIFFISQELVHGRKPSPCPTIGLRPGPFSFPWTQWLRAKFSWAFFWNLRRAIECCAKKWPKVKHIRVGPEFLLRLLHSVILRPRQSRRRPAAAHRRPHIIRRRFETIGWKPASLFTLRPICAPGRAHPSMKSYRLQCASPAIGRLATPQYVQSGCASGTASSSARHCLHAGRCRSIFIQETKAIRERS